jgi:ssDNA-binding Zn-finger/Zn-ribbon topoisomerase 1
MSNPWQTPKEPCPVCGSKLLAVTGEPGDMAVICTECGCKGFEHVNRPLAILCWDSGASQMRRIMDDAKTLGWTGPLPEPVFHPMSKI